ncbi:MAG TPA: glycosyltransferase family 9 protein [Bryobacteraceae bacterium]|nr:glycosyltransferase family 9 protein [Bryobacteraceae bacterium]
MPLKADNLDRLDSGSRVAVLRLRSLGDCVLSTPAIHLLKQARPDLRIAVVVEDRFAAVFENNADIDSVLPPRAGELRSFAPALCINLHGGTRSARLTLLSGARFRAGFEIFRPGWVYSIRIPTAQETLGVSRRVHTAEHMASAMFYLGVPITDVPRARVEPQAGRSSYAPGKPYAVMHPLAATPEKTWPADRFRELARHLEQSMGWEIVFIGGASEDLSTFQPHRTVSGAPLGEIVKLMRDAAFFAGNDSGPAHVAAAFGVPQIVLFGPSDSEVWAPWRTPAEILKSQPIGRITVEQAIQAADRLRVAA